MKQSLWKLAGMVAVAPAAYGTVAWLNWWLPQMSAR